MESTSPQGTGTKPGGGRGGLLLGLLSASGVLAAVVAFALPKIYDAAAGKLDDSSKEPSVKVTVDIDGQFIPTEGSLWAFAEAAPEVGNGSADDVRAAGAVPVRQVVVVATVENVGSRPLTITSIRAVVDMPRKDPLAGTILHVAPGGGGGEDPPVAIGFALDTEDLEARTMSAATPTATHYLDQYGMTLKPGEQMRLRMAGYTTKHHVAWSAVMRHAAGGNTYETQIGAPKQFQVTAASARYVGAYEYSTQALRQVPVGEMCGADCRTFRG